MRYFFLYEKETMKKEEKERGYAAGNLRKIPGQLIKCKFENDRRPHRLPFVFLTINDLSINSQKLARFAPFCAVGAALTSQVSATV